MAGALVSQWFCSLQPGTASFLDLHDLGTGEGRGRRLARLQTASPCQQPKCPQIQALHVWQECHNGDMHSPSFSESPFSHLEISCASGFSAKVYFYPVASPWRSCGRPPWGYCSHGDRAPLPEGGQRTQPHQGGQGPQARSVWKPTATHPAQRLADLNVTQPCDQAHTSTLAPIFQVGRLRPDLSSGGDLIISLKPRPTCQHPINSALQVCPGCAPFSPLSKLPSALPAACQQPPNWPLVCPPCGGRGDSMKSPSRPGPSRGSHGLQAKAQVLTLLGPPPPHLHCVPAKDPASHTTKHVLPQGLRTRSSPVCVQCHLHSNTFLSPCLKSHSPPPQTP